MIPRRASFNHLRRLWIAGVILAAAFVVLIYRLFDLSVIHRHFLQKQWSERTVRDIVIPSYRGIIADRNNVPLAVSTPVYAAWCDPQTLEINTVQLLRLSKLINLPAMQINKLIQKNRKRQFIYLKRNISPDLSIEINHLNIKGLFLEKQYRRFYPATEAAAQTTGITNVDDQGQEGLELLYNAWLAGKPGIQRIMKDRYGNKVADLGVIKTPVPGRDLTLSIDSRLQYIAYNELLNSINNFNAKSGSVVILNVHTGEILAMVNVPSFNPNARGAQKSGNYRNRCMTDLFEPGSTIKAFAMAQALSTGKYSPDSMINTAPGYWYVENKKIDDDGHNEGLISLTKILEVSSNVGMSKVILSIVPHGFLNFLKQLGFTQTTGINFPGESRGTINKNAARSAFVYATVSFGYGISVNLLQLAGAYATLANNGIKVPLSLIKVNVPPDGVQIIKPAVAAQIRSMLEYVLLQGGTGTAARVPGYRVTGKTGTVRILGRRGYDKYHHNSLFVGIAPATHPEIVSAVFIHNPLKKAYFGGFVAGPAFSRIMGAALRILNIAPDNISDEVKK